MSVNSFEYDGSQRGTLEISAVCESCPGGGSTSVIPQRAHPADAEAISIAMPRPWAA